jgi:import inner membrane translocase subunit TIM54
MGKQVLEGGSLAEVRKIKVYGARCPEDGDDDRALRYFRKYMKVRPIED